MLYEVDWAEDGTYRPDEYYSPEKFFNDCLVNSKEFDLQLGYFSSATISVLADGFASFISNGGKMRLVINHIVSDEDKMAISKGIYGGIIDCFDLSNFEELKKTFDEYQQQFFECLAFLIYNKRIDIRIIKPRNKKGIAHTKSGQFRDGDSTTSFTGSANFTISGLFNNLEEIKIDRSDSIDKMVQKRIKSQREEFESIMSERKQNIEYLTPDNLISAIQTSYGSKDIEELLDVETKLRKIKRQKSKNASIVRDDNELDYMIQPCFPYPSGPRDYQETAFENWKNNGQKGLFAMATGTGKTLTALNVLLNIYNKKNYYKAVILVPTITLAEQWCLECKKFNFNNVILVSSKNKNWKERLSRLTFELSHSNDNNNISYIIISTYASFSRDDVFDLLNSFSRTQVLFIADEAHNIGSPKLLKKLDNINYLRRIGLSATPERQFEDDVNKKIYSFFGVEFNFTYEYSMQDAIQNGVLCRYFYYPHIVALNEEEMESYSNLSAKISKYYNFTSETFDKQDQVLMSLLLARKRIIHKACNKIDVFKDIIRKRFIETGSLKYTLVYVPEGLKPDDNNSDLFTTIDTIPNDEEADRLIDLYTKAVYDIAPKVTVKKFTGDTKDRDIILEDFAKGKLNVLTSMKCLDEGVDVPRSEVAIFCSSTGNPRQFIQRRGRVLRPHPLKHFSELHDLVVIPKLQYGSDSYKLERSMLKTELLRVKNFALLAENPSYTELTLRHILDYYGLNLYNNSHI